MNLVLLLLLLVLVFALMTAVYRLHKKSKESERLARHLMQNLRYELNTKLQVVERQAYRQLPGNETIVYDGRAGMGEKDFTGNGARVWDYVAHRFEGSDGTGRLRTEGNTLCIERTNTDGRYELHLHRFVFDGKETTSIPASTEQSVRHLRLTFGVKKETASHQLRVVFKGKASKEVLAEKDYVVFNPDWEAAELFFSVATTESCGLRIDDLEVLEAPSRIWLRNVVLREKK